MTGGMDHRHNSPAAGWSLALWERFRSCSCLRELRDALRPRAAAGADPPPGSNRAVHPVLELPDDGRSAGRALSAGARARPEATPRFSRRAWTMIRSRSTCSTIATHSPIFSSSIIPSCRRGAHSSWHRGASASSTLTRARGSRKTCDTRRPMPCSAVRTAICRSGSMRARRVLRDRPGRARCRARANRSHRRRRRGGWSPSLPRLESLSDIRQMTPRDYREAWAWVHLLLNGSPVGERRCCSRRCSELHEGPDKLRLEEKGATNERLLAHIKFLQDRAIRRAMPSRQTTPIRLQDKNPRNVPPRNPAATARLVGGESVTWIGILNIV